MSEQNVEIVRQVYAASARRDTEAVLSLYDPEVEWNMSQHPMSEIFEDSGSRHGHDGIRSWFHEWYEAFSKFEHHCEELIAVGDQVVSVGTDVGVGRASDVEVTRPIAGLWTIREGKIVRVAWFPTHAEALEAAGLSE